MIHSGQAIQYTDHWSSEKNINTHIQIMKSDPVLQKVIKILNLGTPSNSPVQPKALKGYFTIEPVKDTNLIRIKADLERRGKLIDDFDIAIAAIAAAHECGVITANPNHFRRIEDIESKSWRRE